MNTLIKRIKKYSKYLFWYVAFGACYVLDSLGFKLREDKIPEGPYCYSVIEDESGSNRIKLCPYYIHIENEPQGDSCCIYERFIGWDAGFCDLCKICGVNSDDNENYIK